MTAPTPSGPRSARRRGAGVVGSVVGAAAAGIAAGVAAERLILRRQRRGGDRDPHRDEPFGAVVADEYRTVITAEGIALHVEIDGPATAPLTVVFVHGYCLDLGTFHFQRRALREVPGVRLVQYDQPGHGRSGRLAKGEYTMDLLAKTLMSVLDATTPKGPVILIGHSMGGMSILALADHFPELFKPGSRIAGIVLISSSAGQMDGVSFGLPRVLAAVRKPLLPLLTGAGSMTAGVVDRARDATSDLFWLLTRRYGFGSRPASPALVSYVDQMNSCTRTESVARYLRAIYTHDRMSALAALIDTPALVICGEEDMLTPVEHSEVICAALPDAELVIVPNGGHVVLLEYAEECNAVIVPFVRKLIPGS